MALLDDTEVVTTKDIKDAGLYILTGIGLIGCFMCLYEAVLSSDVLLAIVSIVAIIYILGLYVLIGRLMK